MPNRSRLAVLLGVAFAAVAILASAPTAQIGTGPGIGFPRLPSGCTTGQGVTFSTTSGAWGCTALGTGTVTSVSVVTANGFSGTVATSTTTPAITIVAGAITPTSISLGGTNLTFSATAPTRVSGFGTNADASFATGSTATAFDMNIGTGGTPTSGVMGLPTAAHGWACQVTDITTTADVTSQSAYTVSQVTLTSTLAWSANDHLVGGCKAF